MSWQWHQNTSGVALVLEFEEFRVLHENASGRKNYFTNGRQNFYNILVCAGLQRLYHMTKAVGAV